MSSDKFTDGDCIPLKEEFVLGETRPAASVLLCFLALLSGEGDDVWIAGSGEISTYSPLMTLDAFESEVGILVFSRALGGLRGI